MSKMDTGKECGVCFTAGFLVDKVSLFPVLIGFVLGNFFSETCSQALKITFKPVIQLAKTRLGNMNQDKERHD